MNGCMAVIDARFRSLLQYRTAAFAGICTQIFWGLVRIIIFSAFFSANQTSQPLSLEQTITYIWLGQAFLALLPWNTDPDFQIKINEGAIAHDLLRPSDLYFYWFSSTLAFRLAPACLRFPPLLLFAFYLMPLFGYEQWTLTLPESAGVFFVFFIALVFAVLLATSITMLMQISMLWTISGAGVDRLAASLVILASGMIIPLPFYPGFIQPLLMNLPFRGLVDVPFRIYSGSIDLSHALNELLFQFGWLSYPELSLSQNSLLTI